MSDTANKTRPKRRKRRLKVAQVWECRDPEHDPYESPIPVMGVTCGDCAKRNSTLPKSKQRTPRMKLVSGERVKA